MNSVKRTFLLVRVMLKSGGVWQFEGSGGLGRKKKKKKRRNRLATTLMLIFFLGYMAAMAIMLGKGMAPSLIALGMDQVYFELFLVAFVLMTIVFGFFSAFSALAFSQDQERLVTMPVKRGELLLARMTMIFLNQCLLPLALGVPLFATYGYYKQSSWVFYLKVVIGMFLQTLFPVAILVILSLILIRFTPLARNKDRFMIISQVVVMIMTMAIIFGSQSIGNKVEDMSGVEINDLNPGFYPVISKIVPNLDFLKDFLMLEGWPAFFAFLKFLALGLVAIGIAYAVANSFYKPESSSGGKTRQLTAKELGQSLQAQSKFRTLLTTEWKLIRRNPSILTNNILGSFLVPIFVLVPLWIFFFSQSRTQNLSSVRQGIQQILTASDPELIQIIFVTVALAFMALGHFIFGSGALNASAISREGQNITRYMAMPCDMMQLLQAKTLLSYLISVLPFMLVLVIVALVLAVPVQFTLAWLFFYAVAVYNVNQIDLLVDVTKPALDWENEIYAVKGNKMILISMVINWALALIYGLLIYLMYKQDVELAPWTALAIACAVMLLEAIALNWAIPRRLKKTLSQIESYL